MMMKVVFCHIYLYSTASVEFIWLYCLQTTSLYLINLHEDRNRADDLKCLGSDGWSNRVDLKASVD